MLHKSITSTLAAATILLGTVSPAFAVSGGGLDFAGTNISEKDFSSQSKYMQYDCSHNTHRCSSHTCCYLILNIGIICIRSQRERFYSGMSIHCF